MRAPSGMLQQVADALLQQAHYLGQRQHHLNVGVLFGCEPAELLHGSLLFDLVLSLHSDSLLFLGRKNSPSAHYGRGLRVATFYGLPGILPTKCSGALHPRTCRTMPLLKDMRRHLRHTDPRTTLKHYAKVIPTSLRAAVAALDAQITGTSINPK